MTDKKDELIFRPTTRAERLDLILERIKRGGGTWVRGAALAGAMAATVPGVSGCAFDVDEIGVQQQALLTSSGQDWAQARGERNREMVRFDGHYWHSQSDCGTRFGCSTTNYYIQLFVRPVAGVDLEQKKVGIVYRPTGTYTQPKTVNGHYVRTRDDGLEEWHVPVALNLWSDGRIMNFNAWYEDGNWFFHEPSGEWRKRTYYDDNAGDLYPVVTQATQAIVYNAWGSSFNVTQEGVKGKVQVRITNFDYEKEVAMVYTTDGWKTFDWVGMGSPDQKNGFYWVRGYGPEGQPADYEQWEADLDLAGPVEKFEFAFVYRHGLNEGARRYEFWDNNWGRNYTKDVTPTTPPLE